MSAIHHQLPQYAFCTQKVPETKTPKPKTTVGKPSRARSRQVLPSVDGDGSTVPGYN